MRGDSCFMSYNHTLSCMLKADTCFLQIFSTIVKPVFNCRKFSFISYQQRYSQITWSSTKQ